MPGAEILTQDVTLEPKPVAATPALEPKETPVVPPVDPTVPPVDEQPKEGEESTEEPEPDLDTAAEEGLEDGPLRISKYKPLYKDFPELRGMVARDNRGKEVFPGGVKEMIEFRELIPTMEDAEQLTAASEQLRTFSENFKSDPDTFIESLRDSDNNAFLKLAQEMPRILANVDTRAYEEQARFYGTSVLENLQAKALNSGDPDVQRAWALLNSRFVGLDASSDATRQNRPDPRDTELERLRRRERERQTAELDTQVDTFIKAVEVGYIEEVVQDITTRIKSAIPSATDSQVERMTKEVWAKLQEKNNSQPQTSTEVERAKAAARNGRTGTTEQRNLKDFLVRRSKATVPGILKAVVTDWSDNVLRLSKDKIESKEKIASRTKDAGSGAGAGGGTAPPQKKQVGPRTTAQILTELQTGTYQR